MAGELAPPTIVGNCTRWPQAGSAAPKHSANTMPRKQQSVEEVIAFKLGTECVKWIPLESGVF